MFPKSVFQLRKKIERVVPEDLFANLEGVVFPEIAPVDLFCEHLARHIR